MGAILSCMARLSGGLGGSFERKTFPDISQKLNGCLCFHLSEGGLRVEELCPARSHWPFSILPAFYTSRYGYKMCLRVYLNGDGTGRGTHLSLFFVVMKGPNDALLRWPFNQKV